MENPTYLGDGVYAQVHLPTGIITLTTGHHDPIIANNVIDLEPEVLQKLRDWLVTSQPRPLPGG